MNVFVSCAMLQVHQHRQQRAVRGAAAAAAAFANVTDIHLYLRNLRMKASVRIHIPFICLATL
jgi:hypothetical protein